MPQVLDDGLADIVWQREPVDPIALASHDDLACPASRCPPPAEGGDLAARNPRRTSSVRIAKSRQPRREWFRSQDVSNAAT